MIEFVTGEETHPKKWGKFHVFGLEDMAIKKVHNVNRRLKESYYQYKIAEPPPFTVFSIFEKSGDTNGEVTTFTFILCCTQPGLTGHFAATYGDGFVHGDFSELARGSGTIKAQRLMDWWATRPANVDPIEYANHCAIYIAKRGVEILPPLPE